MTTPARRGGRPARRAERARLTVQRRHARRLARFLDTCDPAEGVGWGVRLYREGVRASVGVELRRGTVLGAGLPGMCFEAGFAYAERHADVPGLRLVHGLVVEEGFAWVHTWVELGEVPAVFCPTTGRFYEAASFHEVLQTAPLVSYTAAQALARRDAEGHPGPWPEFEAILRGEVAARTARLLDANPDLAGWFAAMLDRDRAYAAEVEETARRHAVTVLHILTDLAARPEKWRAHRPGLDRWPGPVHPLGASLR